MVLQRHPKKYKHFIRIMLSQLIEHENITTTKTKAIHLRPYAQKLLNFAKRAKQGQKSPLNLLKGRIHTKKIQTKLLVDLIPRIRHIRGGFIQIHNTRQRRRGDNAAMVQLSIKGNQKTQFNKKRQQEALKKKLVPDLRSFEAKILIQQKQFLQKKLSEMPESQGFFKRKIEQINQKQMEIQRNQKQPPKYSLLI